ncbi:anti-sigma factor antagonist [Collinsella sp. An307]|uniref:anti-sigma factor antagonist n=1 Tax=Collinsella sp. An307 TaxID=1965630 RepID=UPI000B37C3DF|nr:anti-sigma factor antagonist [Collinsella sp. An307]OUO21676.1 sulfate transporter [Collinsella sp. An307]
MREWMDIAVLAPVSDIDIATVPGLRSEVDSLIAAGTRRILLNCENVTFIDSTGLAFLLSRARRLIQEGGMLSLVNVSAEVSRFLQIARLISVLHVTARDRPPVPVLSPGTLPVWSRSISVAEGIEHLGLYRHRVVELLETLPLGRDAVYDTALAAGEALGNAYDHAGAAGCMLNVRAYEDRVVIEVCDCGGGFEIAPDEDVAESEERGRGIKLMRMLVDSAEVKRRADVQGTMVRLIKLFAPAA